LIRQGWAFALVLCLLAPPLGAAEQHRLVFGSFTEPENAQHWAREVARDLGVATSVVPFEATGGGVFRVVSEPLDADRIRTLSQAAQSKGIASWRLLEVVASESDMPGMPPQPPANVSAPELRSIAGGRQPLETPARGRLSPTPTPHEIDLDLGLQTRSYAERGLEDQSRFQPSFSGRLQYYRSWDDGRSTFRLTPFGRIDAEDDERTHADLRELEFTRVGDDWEFHAGLRQVFWGVTEFEHLVDIVNQTDLVENIDGEDKLGQPMVDLSFVRDWGVLDLIVLPGFRERTFPGKDGRLRYVLPVDTRGARYESGDEQWHVDGVVRWMHNVGPIEFGLYQFKGTSRDPDLVPTVREDGRYVLTPYYPQIDQTGLDAQAIVGDWLWKLEALRRSGQGGSYSALTGGLEWTWVGAMGSRSDIGWVVEYMYDDRGDQAPTSFEHDVGFATRWRLNDVADTQALLGLIWDPESGEYIFKLEGNRRLGDDWALTLEGRLFGGASAPPTGPAEAVLAALLDPDNKTGAVQRDDYLQVELIRFF